MNDPVVEISQDKSSSEKAASVLPATAPSSQTAMLAGISAGAVAGAVTGHYALNHYTHEALDQKGWFDQLKKIYQRGEHAVYDDVIGDMGDAENLMHQPGNSRGQYFKACESLMQERGVSNWSQRWKQLSGSQKTKTLAFAAGAAVLAGAVVYKGMDQWMQGERDNTPAR